MEAEYNAEYVAMISDLSYRLGQWRGQADALAKRLDAHVTMCDAIDDTSRHVLLEYHKLAAQSDGRGGSR